MEAAAPPTQLSRSGQGDTDPQLQGSLSSLLADRFAATDSFQISEIDRQLQAMAMLKHEALVAHSSFWLVKRLRADEQQGLGAPFNDPTFKYPLTDALAITSSFGQTKGTINASDTVRYKNQTDQLKRTTGPLASLLQSNVDYIISGTVRYEPEKYGACGNSHFSCLPVVACSCVTVPRAQLRNAS
jgi:hypothetical protein